MIQKVQQKGQLLWETYSIRIFLSIAWPPRRRIFLCRASQAPAQQLLTNLKNSEEQDGLNRSTKSRSTWRDKRGQEGQGSARQYFPAGGGQEPKDGSRERKDGKRAGECFHGGGNKDAFSAAANF